nr:hypothetical protein [Rothia nasimurium]
MHPGLQVAGARPVGNEAGELRQAHHGAVGSGGAAEGQYASPLGANVEYVVNRVNPGDAELLRVGNEGLGHVYAAQFEGIERPQVGQAQQELLLAPADLIGYQGFALLG